MTTEDTIQVVRVNEDDIVIVNFIVDNLIEYSAEKPASEHLQTLLSDDRTYLFAAILDNNIIGYALTYRFPSLCSSGYLAYLYDIEVLEIYRRKGAGRLLIQTMLVHLKSDGVSELWLGTAVGNNEGQALFASTGGINDGESFNEFVYEL
jgi:ribosomal protein S18 acetylase RimI-like enzyme